MRSPVADGGEPGISVHAPDGSDIARPLIAEALGGALFAFCTVATGILAERFAIHNVGLALLMTALAGTAAFVVLSLGLGAHARLLFNPAVAFAGALGARVSIGNAVLTGAVQIAGAFVGVMLAHMVTNTGLVQVATQVQTGPGVWAGEFIVTALFVYMALSLSDGWPRSAACGGVLLAAALATPSTSLANPALTLARALTDSFTSIRLEDAILIAGIQMLAALAAWALHGWLTAKPS
jgi:glycerol uptake facilitator-like aquaporin